MSDLLSNTEINNLLEALCINVPHNKDSLEINVKDIKTDEILDELKDIKGRIDNLVEKYKVSENLKEEIKQEFIISEEDKNDSSYILNQNEIDEIRKKYKDKDKSKLKSTVLIVDDAAFMRMMLKDILEHGDYEVIGQAGDGISGLRKFFELRPNIVVVDICMPEMDGLKMIEEIKRSGLSTYIVVCSAMGQYVHVERAFELGADDFVVKPFQPQRILPFENSFNRGIL